MANCLINEGQDTVAHHNSIPGLQRDTEVRCRVKVHIALVCALLLCVHCSCVCIALVCAMLLCVHCSCVHFAIHTSAYVALKRELLLCVHAANCTSAHVAL